VRPAAKTKNIQLQLQLDPLAGPISGDAERLQQVVWNLLTNAVKFTPDGGQVHVKSERVDSYVHITVRDSGKGIDFKFLPDVFDRFRQADQTSTRAYGGLGLGLSIVRQIVELHGGTIHAHSEGAGLGSTFVVQLPLSTARPEIEEPDLHDTGGNAATLDGVAQLKPWRILVVDDELDTREFLRLVLNQCGLEVMTAGSSAEALELFQLSHPDVLVSDIGMPGEDGYSLIGKVRAWEGTHGGCVPAIAMTAYASRGDRIHALEAGFQVHLPKPVDPAELVALVASLAERSG
jgi:CheY-like chemotaxis protein